MGDPSVEMAAPGAYPVEAGTPGQGFGRLASGEDSFRAAVRFPDGFRMERSFDSLCPLPHERRFGLALANDDRIGHRAGPLPTTWLFQRSPRV